MGGGFGKDENDGVRKFCSHSGVRRSGMERIQVQGFGWFGWFGWFGRPGSEGRDVGFTLTRTVTPRPAHVPGSGETRVTVTPGHLPHVPRSSPSSSRRQTGLGSPGPISNVIVY